MKHKGAGDQKERNWMSSFGDSDYIRGAPWKQQNPSDHSLRFSAFTLVKLKYSKITPAGANPERSFRVFSLRYHSVLTGSLLSQTLTPHDFQNQSRELSPSGPTHTASQACTAGRPAEGLAQTHSHFWEPVSTQLPVPPLALQPKHFMKLNKTPGKLLIPSFSVGYS